MWTRFIPAVVEMRKRIAEGEIGEVKYVYASMGYPGACKRQRVIDPALGGGGMLSLGVYPINFATMVFGEEPESIHANGWLTSTGAVDHTTTITLK